MKHQPANTTTTVKALRYMPILGTLILNFLLGLVLAAITGWAPAATVLATVLLGFAMPYIMPKGSLAAISTLPNVLWGDGDDNMGGLRTIAYYALHSEVATFTAPAGRTAATNLNDLSTISTAPTFNSGKGWKRFYVTEDTSMVESTIQGEKDGKSWVNKFKGFHPGAKEKLLGLFRYVINAGTLWVGDDAEGTKRLVGSEYYPAKLDTASITTTETAAGRKGTTFEFVASSPYPAPIVKFTISEESAS